MLEKNAWITVSKRIKQQFHKALKNALMHALNTRTVGISSPIAQAEVVTIREIPANKHA